MEFKSVEEIDKFIELFENERSSYDKTNVKEYVDYYELTQRIEELYRIKYDFINSTHTNEIYHLKQKLKSARNHLAMADIMNKKHYWPIINHCKSEINRLENEDNITLSLKK